MTISNENPPPANGAADGSPSRVAWLLIGLGMASGLIYLLRLALPMSLRVYLSQPLIDLPKIIGENPVGAWYYFDTIVALFALYAWGYRALLREGVAQAARRVAQTAEWASELGPIIFLFPLVFSLMLLLMFPVTAGDIFVYIFFGRIWVFQGLNPYLTPPNAFPMDISYNYTVFRDLATVYGALFTHLSAGLAWLAGDSLLLNVLFFKGAMILLHALAVVLVYFTLRRTQPKLVWAGVFLVAWNPLVLFNAAGDGHNDIAMMAVVMLAMFLASRERWTLAAVALVLSASMKWTSVILVPIFFVAGLRALGWRRWPVLVSGLALGVGLAALLHAPFYQGPRSLLGSVPEIGVNFTSSLANVVRDILARIWPLDRAETGARYLAYALFGGLYLRELWRVRGDFTSLAYGCYQAFFLYLVFGTLWFQPWYVTWLVGLGALLVGTPVAWRTVAFTTTAMLIHVVTGFGWRMKWFNDQRPMIQLAAVAVVFAVPVVMWLVEEMTDRARADKPVLVEAPSEHSL